MMEKLFKILKMHYIQNENQKICALFDGVKYPMLWSDLEDGVLEYDMLFREENLRKEMEKVAPFLVALDFNSEVGLEQTKELLKCYGKNGCIFIASSLELTRVLSSMRELFYVYTGEGDKGYMRFYEPKIFSSYIKQKDPNIRYALFSNVDVYWCEESENILKQYTKHDTDYCTEKTFSLGKKI